MSTPQNKRAASGRKLTGWPRPQAGLGASMGLNPLRMALLAALAIGGLGAGYVVGKYVAPAEPDRPSEVSGKTATPALPSAPPRTLPGYEESLPRDIVIESNGQLQRLTLPEPAAELDFGPKKTPDSPELPDLDVSEPSEVAPTNQPDRPETLEKPATEVPAQETPAAAERTPTIETAALPNDIAALQRQKGDALPTWQRFAVPVVRDGRPKIVIVIDDLGLDRRRSRETVELPGPLTMSYMAYAEDLKAQTTSARRAGHELMLHVPMEPSSTTIDPGPNVLLSGMTAPELQSNIDWNLDQVSGYVGINNHMGSRFTSDPDGMALVVQALKKRGLLFLDSLTSGRSVAHDTARDAGIPYAIRNVFLDHEDDLAAINRQLKRTEQVAKQTGLAIAIGHPRDKTLEALHTWLPTLDKKGFQLVPISAVVRVARGG